MINILTEYIELNTETSEDTRRKIMVKEKQDELTNCFQMVIFPGKVQVVASVNFPTCVVEKFDQARLLFALGLSDNTLEEDISDKLKDIFFLSSLGNTKIRELKDIFQVNFLDDLIQINIFYQFGTFCQEKYMTKHYSKIEFVINSLPVESPNYFCWLQILPIIQSYPSLFLKSFKTECKIKDLKIYTKEYSIISEPLITNNNDYLYIVNMNDCLPNDIYSQLYGNQTSFDIYCLFQQCEQALNKFGKNKRHKSYRLRFLSFLINDPKAKFPYMALKVYKETQNGKSFLWYK